MTEAEIIAALTRAPRTDGPGPGDAGLAVRVGIGDDGAVLADGTVLTVDTMVEGTHWDHRLTPADVGWKLVAVNASDLGAMGARPRVALLALTLPAPADPDWLAGFRAGLFEALDAFGLVLVGGDTVVGPARALTLTAIGHAVRPVLRSTGQPGDDVYVTGDLGLAAEGFLSASPSARARAALARPRPPTQYGVALADAGLATAMMDLSDGLHADLGRLCVASGVSAEIEPGWIPGVPDLAWRVAFGEDYELLYTAPKSARSAVESLAASHGVATTRIGSLTPPRASSPPDGYHPFLVGASWPQPLFTHFPRS